MSRRTFVQTSLAAVAASAVPRGAMGQHTLGSLGLQLYSVRDSMKADVPGTLAKVAAIGFKEVEFAGLFGQNPKDVRAMLDKSGLTAPASHVDMNTVDTKLAETIETATILGHKFVIVPYVDETARKQPDIWKRLADILNRAAAQTQKAGIEVAYHQHGFEFVPSSSLGGKMPYDYLLENTGPAVKMELDICWTVAAEQDPVVYFKKYPGRFPLIHVKDWLKNGKPGAPYAGALGPDTKFTGEMANVGQGSIDWKSVLAGAQTAGVKHFIVEHDNPKSIDDLAGSYQYLKKLSF